MLGEQAFDSGAVFKLAAAVATLLTLTHQRCAACRKSKRECGGAVGARCSHCHAPLAAPLAAAA